MIYNDFDLKRGDDDSKRNWGGTTRAESVGTFGSGPYNALALPGPVSDLQRDLQRVGILLGPAPNGVFDEKTEWAVREFQAYAKMDNVAKENTKAGAPSEYADRLTAVATGTHRYGGPVSGVMNAASRAAMEQWLKDDWRCPVVLDVWDEKATPPVRVARNIWHPEDQSGGDKTVKARDFSGYHRPQGSSELWKVGYRALYYPKAPDKSVVRIGPSMLKPHGEAACEVLPESLIGRPWAALAAAERSSFKVVRAVCEVECLGFADIVNAYDGGVVSVGIFHFIFGREGIGELAQVLNELSTTNLSDYERGIVFFGMDVRPATVGKKTAPAKVKLQDDSGAFPQEQPYPKDYIRSWHWFYRYVMMVRTCEPFRRIMWKKALDRIRLIRTRKVDETLVPPTVGPNGPVPATIGDVFTSELNIGYLLRNHVNFPSDVVNPTSGKLAGAKVNQIIKHAQDNNTGVDWKLPPAQWTDAHEAALADAVAKVPKSNNELTKSMPKIKTFPNPDPDNRWQMNRQLIGPLAEGRGTFQMAAFAQPAPPPPAPTPPAPPNPAPPPNPGPAP